MKVACVIALSLLAGTAAVSAHHSFAAEYEGDKPVTITGKVAKIGGLEGACQVLHHGGIGGVLVADGAIRLEEGAATRHRILAEQITGAGARDAGHGDVRGANGQMVRWVFFSSASI